ncbi:MAG: Cof-type HAD-IIB family hydrolase [Lachnospiraceae bacterium]|jgi:Cof subfamily protein (haloacid dehalogenase superfamily)
MSIRCIALDIDGTILGHDKILSKENESAIREAIDAGIEIVIASGRVFEALPSCIMQIPGIRYAITSNGAAVYHIPTGECIHRYKLSSAAIEKIMEVTAEDDIIYEVFMDGKAYTYAPYVRNPMAYGASSYAVPYIQSTRIPVEDMETFILQHKNELDSLALIHKTEDTMTPVWEKLEACVNGIYITTSVPKLLEIADERAGKKSGLEYILRLLGFKSEEAAAFGNADNDWEMIAYAGYGVAVADASERCKEAADYVTRTCDENGVAYALHSILEKMI